MSRHRTDTNIKELKTYFNSVIDWVSSVFTDVKSDMCGLEWGRMYEAYHKKAYDPAKVSKAVQKLFADPYVKNPRGIFEFVLGGESDVNLLDVRIFDEATKREVHRKQTENAKSKGESNCPHCAMGHEANAAKIWQQAEMEADHVAAWSKQNPTDIKNCQMLCKTHNRAKGNR